jgi:hypothetical protein
VLDDARDQSIGRGLEFKNLNREGQACVIPARVIRIGKEGDRRARQGSGKAMEQRQFNRSRLLFNNSVVTVWYGGLFDIYYELLGGLGRREMKQ